MSILKMGEYALRLSCRMFFEYRANILWQRRAGFRFGKVWEALCSLLQKGVRKSLFVEVCVRLCRFVFVCAG